MPETLCEKVVRNRNAGIGNVVNARGVGIAIKFRAEQFDIETGIGQIMNKRQYIRAETRSTMVAAKSINTDFQKINLRRYA